MTSPESSNNWQPQEVIWDRYISARLDIYEATAKAVMGIVRQPAFIDSLPGGITVEAIAQPLTDFMIIASRHRIFRGAFIAYDATPPLLVHVLTFLDEDGAGSWASDKKCTPAEEAIRMQYDGFNYLHTVLMERSIEILGEVRIASENLPVEALEMIREPEKIVELLYPDLSCLGMLDPVR